MFRLLFAVCTLAGGLLAVSPWLGDGRQQQVWAWGRVKHPAPAMPSSEQRAMRLYRVGGLAAAGLVALVGALALPGPRPFYEIPFGLIAGTSAGMVGSLLAEAFRHRRDKPTPRASAALRHVTLSDYVPLPHFLAALALPLVVMVASLVAGMRWWGALPTLISVALTALAAPWFISQPEQAGSLEALWWRDSQRSMLLLRLTVIPVQMAYLPVGIDSSFRWGFLIMWGALVVITLVTTLLSARVVVQRFERRLWPAGPPSTAPVTAAPTTV